MNEFVTVWTTESELGKAVAFWSWKEVVTANGVWMESGKQREKETCNIQVMKSEKVNVIIARTMFDLDWRHWVVVHAIFNARPKKQANLIPHHFCFPCELWVVTANYEKRQTQMKFPGFEEWTWIVKLGYLYRRRGNQWIYAGTIFSLKWWNSEPSGKENTLFSPDPSRVFDISKIISTLAPIRILRNWNLRSNVQVQMLAEFSH